MKEYNEQVVETLDDAGCIIANKNIIIDNFQARIAELEAENERLKEIEQTNDTLLDQLGDKNAALLDEVASQKHCYAEAVAHYEKQLAASQAYAEQLREACSFLTTIKHIEESAVGPLRAAVAKANEALALPRDTSALDTYVAEKVKDAKAEVLDQVRHFKRVREQRDLAVEALENCRLLAARHRKEEWAGHIMRFCKDAGLSGSPIRNDYIKESENNKAS